MIGHYAPSIHFHALILLTEFYTLYNLVKVFFPGKNIQPINGSKTHKIQSSLIMKFVLSAHVTKLGNT